MRWELHKVTDPFEAIQSINSIARPIGIVLFGAEGTLKNRVCDEIIMKIGSIGNCVFYNNAESLDGKTKEAIKKRLNVFCIIGNNPLNLSKRKSITKALRIIGARRIVGVCVIQVTGTLNQNSKFVNDYFINHPPELDGFDELIIVRE